MYSKKLFLITFILWLIARQCAVAAEIKTTIDRNPVSISESFQIIFTATDSPDDDPDFSPLEKEFEILGQSQTTRSSWINGQSSRAILWTVNVIAKRTGQLLIPSIKFGHDHSQPLTIEVTEIKHSIHQTNDDIFIQVEVAPEQVYVQSQLIYSLRLYRRLQLAQASLTEPVMDNAIIEKLADDNNYQTQINGVSYAVTERKYAIFPQNSGVQIISPVTLTAEVITHSRPRFNGFFTRQTTQTRRIKSEAITINVLKAADSFKGRHWLPATRVHIEDKWSDDILQMKVGEPLTRTLILSAEGITSAQLPVLYQPLNQDSIKTYPDQPQLKEQKKASGIVAVREEKIAYIAEKPGHYTLPPIKISWFNIQTGQLEVSQIPAQSIAVEPSTVTVSHLTSTDEIVNTPPIETQTPQTVVQVVENRIWMWVALFFVFIWLVTLFFLVRQSNQPKSPNDRVDNEDLKFNKAVKLLKKACLDNDSQSAKNILLDWGRVEFHRYNLTEIARQVDDESLSSEIDLLNQVLYSRQSSSWQGRSLFQAFSNYKIKPLRQQNSDPALEPLHKF